MPAKNSVMCSRKLAALSSGLKVNMNIKEIQIPRERTNVTYSIPVGKIIIKLSELSKEKDIKMQHASLSNLRMEITTSTIPTSA